ncbi:hypothetical protein [Streptomyces dangxiongensis]|uniref:hypothetical protein n=1 Tax=Streptomyces dangxiongensis TaxID=1442032 RepID=UPI001F09B7C9|nr:hypothetical protein [Streptomyces dangxiongensis]
MADTRKAAEGTAADLAKALRTAWKHMAPGEKTCPWADEATAAYWDRAESLFWPAINRDDSETPRFRSLALEIYDATTRSAATTSQGLHPVAQARTTLTHPRISGRRAKAA